MDSLMRLHLVYHPNKIATIVFGLGLVRLLGTLVLPRGVCVRLVHLWCGSPGWESARGEGGDACCACFLRHKLLGTRFAVALASIMVFMLAVLS